MFWRRSSSSTTRCTYGLYRAFTAAFWALAAFFFAAIPPSLAVKFRALGRAYPGSAPIERGVEDLSDLADPHELHAVAQVLGEVLQVRLVAPGRQHTAHARPLGGERLLLEAADRQHQTRQRQLAGHRRVVAHAAVLDEGPQRGGHRDAGAGTVLRDRARGHVEVDVVGLEVVLGQSLRVRAHVGQRRLRGLLHDVTELARDREPPRAGHRARLDEQHVAADRRPRQARGHAGLGGAPLDVGREARPAEQLAHLGAGRGHLALVGPLRDRSRDLAADRADLALESAHAGLAGVLLDDRLQAGVGERDLRALEAVALDLPRDEVALGDLELLLLRVARELDDLHAVAERARDRVQRVRRRDEHHAREVVGNVEVVVAERRVLLGVEHLEHRAGGIPAVVGAHLVELVDHEDRVLRAGVAQRAHDHAGHRADVGPPVAADLRLVADAAGADALELAAHRAGDRAPEGRLADAGRPDEAQDRGPATLVRELADREELEDAILDLVDVVVVRVEHLARVREVEVVVGRAAPGQRRDPLEPGPDHAVLGRGGRELLEPRELTVGLLAHELGQRQLRELLPQLLHLGLRRVALPELLLDRLELLAQVVLALGLVHLGLDLRVDTRADLDDLELPRERLGEPVQAAGDVVLLEQGLALVGGDAQRPGDQVRQRGGIL